jgi:hypothetical protein
LTAATLLDEGIADAVNACLAGFVVCIYEGGPQAVADGIVCGAIPSFPDLIVINCWMIAIYT